MKLDKTHWLQSPNKNYLGHWDLPEAKDLILTIKSAQWEEVKNPIINVTEAKRVVRFEEDVKPWICNQGNAQSIIQATGIKHMEDSGGSRIALFIGKHMDRVTKDFIDCVRVRSEEVKAKPELTPEHPKWKAAKIAVFAEDTDIDKIRVHWSITDENAKELCS